MGHKIFPLVSWNTGHLNMVREKIGFKIETQYLKLTAPEHPLLSLMQKEISGTLHHCIIVGSAAAIAAYAIGANADIARIIGYYHDIGKLNLKFTCAEAKNGIRNGASLIKDEEALVAIIGHPKSSADILAEADDPFPEVVIKAVAEHHGKSKTKVCVDKALLQQIDAEKLFYPGPLPSSPESAIVMLADSSEAKINTLLHNLEKKPLLTEGYFFQQVSQVANDLENARQFINSGLAPAQLNIVIKKIAWSLFRFYTGLDAIRTPR